MGDERVFNLRDQMTEAYRRANPGLSVVPSPEPGDSASYSPMSARRIIQAGGDAAALFLHPSFLPLEKLFRKLPTSAIFSASPQQNAIIELGAFAVPQQMVFALIDFRFDLYRLSGAAAGDWVPIENRRLSGQIGYDLQVSAYREANLSFELEPTPQIASQQAYDPLPSGGIIAAGYEFNLNIPPQIGNPFFPPSSGPTPPSPTDFANARAAAVSSPGGTGLATLPQRTERYGPLPFPFTMLIRETQRVAFRAIVFRPVPIPLAFFEVDVTGVLMPANVMDSLLAEMAPYTPQGTR